MDEARLVRGPVVLVIRDGWGRNPHQEHRAFNAVELASTPVADELSRSWPSTLVRTCGEDVGLPAGVMGNSEVGHQNIGAGRVVDQEVMRITRTIRDGSFFDNAVLRGAFDHARRTGGRVHLLGLVSDGKVHSDIEHLFSLIELAERLAFPGERLFVHAITDGRDTPPRGGADYIEQVRRRLETVGGRIASVGGRYYAMDRDNRWERVELAYALLTGRGSARDGELRTATDPVEAVRRYYDQPAEPSRAGDEFVASTRIVERPSTPATRSCSSTSAAIGRASSARRSCSPTRRGARCPAAASTGGRPSPTCTSAR
jgi:2,3-bisphosphoglycerate-independent phosphoglycerate mutase